MKPLFPRRIRDRIARLAYDQRYSWAYKLAREAAARLFEFGGNVASSNPPWAIDWHLWQPAVGRPKQCATCVVTGLPEGTLHRALTAEEAIAAEGIVGMAAGPGWAVAVDYQGQPIVKEP